MAAKPNERRAIVIGGSIAGLFVGAFLRRIGWRVDIYERSSIELIGRGVGISAALTRIAQEQANAMAIRDSLDHDALAPFSRRIGPSKSRGRKHRIWLR